MKHMKKFMALFAALALVLAMAVPAFAAGTTYTISTNEADHTYEVYQIFTGDFSEDTLSNVKWGTNSANRGTAAIGASVDSTVIAEITALNGKNEEEIRDAVVKYVDFASNPFAEVTSSSSASVPAGYYIIKDKDGTQDGKTDAYTNYIIKVVDDVTIAPKSSVPTVDKDVKDINDSTDNALGEWRKDADHDVGDVIPFRLTGTLPENYGTYETYKYIFHDTMSKGLTFDKNSVKVYYGADENGTLIDAGGYTVTTKDNADGSTSIDIAFENLKTAAPGATSTDKITVVYDATLNNQAVIGSTGNPNKVNLEFSNNPNGTGTGKTIDHTVIVFTYQVTANKVDQDNKALTGAAFKLSKYDKDSNTWKVVGYQNVKLDASGEPELDADSKYQIVDENATSFAWERIDDGIYKLEEVITPAGYNTIDAVEFEVKATHDGQTLTKLNGVVTDGSIGSLTFVGEASNGDIKTNVENHRGTTLPSTGGIGTTIFYVVGGGLMVGAAVLLVTKKRMENK